jgi:hypothetical protein
MIIFQILIIFLTGSPTLEQGMNGFGFISKPYDPEELLMWKGPLRPNFLIHEPEACPEKVGKVRDPMKKSSPFLPIDGHSQGAWGVYPACPLERPFSPVRLAVT